MPTGIFRLSLFSAARLVRPVRLPGHLCYANLCWTAYRAVPGGPVIALLLHVDKSVGGLPWGSVTILNYRASVEDVEIFAPLPQAQRERHIRLILRRYLHNPRYCCVREVIEYLKTGGESQWM